MSSSDEVPLVTMTITTLNAERTIEDCLNSVFEMDYPREKLEVIIVDASSTDKTLEIAKRFPVKIIVEKGCTRGLGRNLGVQKAQGELVAVVDADKIFPKDWLRKMVKPFNDPMVAYVSGTSKTPKPSTGFVGTVIYYYTRGPRAEIKGG